MGHSFNLDKQQKIRSTYTFFNHSKNFLVNCTVLDAYSSNALESCLRNLHSIEMLTDLKEFVTPIGEALIAICWLFRVGTGIVLQPIHEKVAVFLQDQELSKNDICLKINKIINYDSWLKNNFFVRRKFHNAIHSDYVWRVQNCCGIDLMDSYKILLHLVEFLFFRRENVFFITFFKNQQAHTLSNPLEDRRLPNVSPIPANSVTGLSDMGSAIKFLCFCDVVDMVFVKCFNQESKLGSFLLFAGLL